MRNAAVPRTSATWLAAAAAAAIAAIAVAAVGCGGSVSTAGGVPVSVKVSPPVVQLPASGRTAFAAEVTGAASAVTWVVREGAAGGAISESGLYAAPPTPGTYHVVATSALDTSARGEAIAIVGEVSNLDAFGVRKLHPTVPGGREWLLPDDADLNANAEFVPEYRDISIVQRGAAAVYRTAGSGADAQVRLNVHSPVGAAWWRNVEVTGYFRWTAAVGSGPPHWEIEARGERHSSNSTTKRQVNDGNAPPPGTATWPWWDAFAAGDSLIPQALGTAYHGNVYADAAHGTLALFEKEITHTDGYASEQRGAIRTASGLPPARNAWFGIKFVLRNRAGDAAVEMELWLDADETGTWTRVTGLTDQNGVGADWVARTSTLDGAAAPPYSYARNQLITWAGPWVCFRSDGLAMDFKKLSVREIDPLP